MSSTAILGKPVTRRPSLATEMFLLTQEEGAALRKGITCINQMPRSPRLGGAETSGPSHAARRGVSPGSTWTVPLSSPLASPSLFFCSAPPAKMSPRMSGRQNEHIVPDYPTNNKINTKEAFKTLNNASGDATNEALDDCC